MFFRHRGVGLQVAPWFVLPATTAQSGCGDDGTVRVWRLADTTLLLALLHLPEQVSAVVRGNLIVTAAGTGIAVHQLALHHLPSR